MLITAILIRSYCIRIISFNFWTNILSYLVIFNQPCFLLTVHEIVPPTNPVNRSATVPSPYHYPFYIFILNSINSKHYYYDSRCVATLQCNFLVLLAWQCNMKRFQCLPCVLSRDILSVGNITKLLVHRTIKLINIFSMSLFDWYILANYTAVEQGGNCSTSRYLGRYFHGGNNIYRSM